MELNASQLLPVRWLRPALLCAGWLLVGWLGGFWLRAAWRQAEVAEFRRTVSAVAILASEHAWQTPWESDPKWEFLERRLGLDLVPLEAGNTAEGPIASELTLVPAPTGGWRATITEPLPQPLLGFHALRATRAISETGMNAAWWTLWIVWGGLIAALSLIWRGRRQHGSKWQADVQPWQVILDPKASSRVEFLPHLDRLASPLAANLEDIGAVINSRLATMEQLVARQQLILGNLTEGILAVDHQGHVLFVNEELRHQLSLDLEVGSERPLVEVIRIPRIVELLEYVLQHGSVAEQTVEVGPATRYLRLVAAPLPLGDAASGALLTAIDVSASEQSELARREFIAGASHELKTPLAAIRAYTETLLNILQEDPETAQRFLGNILSQADRMDRLVSGMLQLARSESGALRLKLERIDLATAVKPCWDAAVGLGQAKGLSMIPKFPGSQTLVMADRDAVQTIVSNLLSNAVRYTPPGGQVELAIQPQTETVSITVTDTGIGISAADQERIFERFFRVEKDRSLDTGGTGLGLAIVKQLTQALSGSVQVSSRKGAGTCFEIRLPAVGFTQSSSKASSEPAEHGR